MLSHWIFLLILLSSAAFAHEDYTAADSSEAKVMFAGRVEIIQAAAPTSDQIASLIEDQVHHLFGPMSWDDGTGVPKTDHAIANSKAEKLADARGTYYKITYDYSGTFVLKNRIGSTYTVVLPLNPETIYKEATLPDGTNPCTDGHYQGENDFWYYWSPERDGCRLVENKNYVRIAAMVTRKPNTVSTYPEYNRLADASGTILSTIFIGMDNSAHGRNPLTSEDINANNYRDIRNQLLVMGFTSEVWKDEKTATIVKVGMSQHPYIEEFTKKTAKAKLVVRAFFGPIALGLIASHPFHYLLKDALENSAVVIYDGHSGLGKNLNLYRIETKEGFKIALPTAHYQIYYLNGCSSYSYYNNSYFRRKKSAADPRGTKNLDIMTNGLATAFLVSHPTNMAIIEAIDAWATGKAVTSYQTLAAEIDSDNLFGVNGDEDNPTRAAFVR